METIRKHFYQFNDIYDFDKLDEKAVKELVDLIENNVEPCTDNHLVVSLTGAYFMLKHDTEKAKKYCLRGVELKETECMFCLGCIYEKNRDRENAIKYYEMAGNNELLPGIKTNLHAYNILGLYYEQLGEKSKALEQYIKGSDKGCGESALNAGAVYGDMKDRNNFKKYTLRAIELGNKNGYDNYAVNLCHYEDEETIEAYVDDVMKEKGYNNVALTCARFYRDRGGKYETKKYYRKAVAAGCDDAENEYWSYLDMIR